MIAGDLDGDAPTGRGRWRQPASLKGRMALLLGLVLIPPLLYSVYQTGSAYLAEAHEQERKAASLLDIVVAYQREVLDGTRNLLDTLVRDSSLQNDEASCNAALAAVAKQNPIYRSLAILDATGEIRCSSRPEKPTTAASGAGRRGAMCRLIIVPCEKPTSASADAGSPSSCRTWSMNALMSARA